MVVELDADFLREQLLPSFSFRLHQDILDFS